MVSEKHPQDRPTVTARRVLAHELSSVQHQIAATRRQMDSIYSNWQDAGEELKELCQQEHELKTAMDMVP
jgi:hypothetical protein